MRLFPISPNNFRIPVLLYNCFRQIGLNSLIFGLLETKKAYLKGDQGRRWSTFMEAAIVTGDLLYAGIIFKGNIFQGEDDDIKP